MDARGIVYAGRMAARARKCRRGTRRGSRNLRILATRAAKYGIGLYLYLTSRGPCRWRFLRNTRSGRGWNIPAWGWRRCAPRVPVLELLARITEDAFPKRTGPCRRLHDHDVGESDQLLAADSGLRMPAVFETYGRGGGRGGQYNIAKGVYSGEAGGPGDRLELGLASVLGLEGAKRIVDGIPTTVDILCTSEEAMPTSVGGIKGSIVDYSISQVGPGEYARELWRYAIGGGIGRWRKFS